MLLSAAILPFPHIDPVLFQIGPLALRWYALAYIGGVFLGWMLLKRFNTRAAIQPPQPLLTEKPLDDITVYAIIGIILGGRIGYVLFYNLPVYLEHPLAALAVWQGGMSFHGGLMGMLVAMAIFARRFKIPYLELMDRCAIVAPMGIGFGRLANFINAELWGRVSDVPWAMIFPTGGELPRHPSQLYEASTEGLLLFILLFTLACRTRILDKVGGLSGLFLVGYALARMFCEQFREPDEQIGFLWNIMTMGQLLSLPLLLLGSFLLGRALLKPKT
jgi:phosphatidylglycerol:prolipoprotein diacylglycerol transferase